MQPSVSRLRTQLEAGRWRLKCGADALSEQLDLPGGHVSITRPLFWVVAGLVGGLALSRFLPQKATPSSGSASPLIGAAISIAGTLLATALVHTLETHPPGHDTSS